MAEMTISLTRAPELRPGERPVVGGPGTFHFHFPTQGQLSRTAYGPEELMGIFLSRWMCKQMTGQGGVACGFLIEQQLQGVTPGTAICSPPPLDLSQPGSPTQSGI